VTWRSVAVYWVLGVALAGVVYTDWRANNPVEAEIERPASPVVVADAPIDGVVARHGERILEIRREDDRWRLQQPAGVRLPSDLVDALVDTLITLSPVEIVEEADTRADEFGLAPPMFSIRLETGQRTLATVDLGKRNPTRTAVYARVQGVERIYLLGLNARYYAELIYEEIDKQLSTGPAGP
jgi:hypothetical protein